VSLCDLYEEPVLFPLQLAGANGYRTDWIDERPL
jgi:hypothetical protein